MDVDYIKEIPVLKDVSPQYHSKIYKIVNLPKLTVEKRAELLEDFMTVAQLRAIKIWMEKKAGDFISMLTESDQEFAEEYMEKKNIEVLDAILDSYDINTKDIYNTWKKNSGFLKEPPPAVEDKEEPIPQYPPAAPSTSKCPPRKISSKAPILASDNSDTDDDTPVPPPIPKPKPKPKPRSAKKNISDDSVDSPPRPPKLVKPKPRIVKPKPPVEPPVPRVGGPSLGKNDLEVSSNGFKVPIGFFEDLPPITNILILGSTGVGKSTFINGLVNYLSFDNIQDAKNQGFHVLIKSAFSHTDENLECMRIEMEPTINAERYGMEHDEEEDTKDGQSATQSPKSYLFQLGPPECQKQIRIIDTPGVGDTRGTIQDQKNFTKILNFIADFEEIHAILLLLEPNKARLDLTFRYCINELLTHLHASAAKNILFCFTKARQTFYRPGESFTCLKTHLDNLYQTTKIEVPLNETNMFCFDNESFRFLCAWRRGADFTDRDITNFSESWSKAVEQNFKMLDRIKKLHPHKVSDTLSVNNVRLLVSTLARPLAEIARNQLVNMRLIDDKLAEIEECIRKKTDLRGRLVMETVDIDTEELDQPITVCTHKNCVEHKTLNDGGVVETIYSQECHTPCYLDGVETSVCPNPEIQNCEVFVDPEQCSECGHSWQVHMHMRYRLIQNIIRTEDPTIGKEVRDRDSQIAAARVFIEEQEVKRNERQAEADKIQHYCAHFAAFLKKHSIIPYNDAYLEYLDHLIKEEQNKFEAGGHEDVLNELKNFRDAYDQQRIIFNNDTNAGIRLKTLAEINDMVIELQNLTYCGEVVQEVQNVEMLSVRKDKRHTSTAVRVNNTLINKAFAKGTAVWGAVKNIFY